MLAGCRTVCAQSRNHDGTKSEIADTSGPTPDLAAEVKRLQDLVEQLQAEVARLTAERDAATTSLHQSRIARRIPAGRMNMNGRDV